jgi:P4 family phage/plasmid primase-like protien
MNEPSARFKVVSLTHPCPKCGKPDWCAISSDGKWCVCRRVGGDGATEKTDKSGATYFLHKLLSTNGNSKNRIAHRPPRQTVATAEKADLEVHHKVYSALLSELPLLACHANDLIRRGLKAGQGCGFAERFPGGYRTLGNARVRAVEALATAGLQKYFPQVPGFWIKQSNGKLWWTFGGWGGLLVPVRDEQKRIVALLQRADPGRSGPKYTYASSKKHGGPGPGSPVHVPLFDGCKTVCRITEGALKADIATALSGMLTVGLPGVSSWRRTGKLLHSLGVTTVRLAFDADCRLNLMVAEALAHLAQHLQPAGFVVELETWPIELGKGIDDLLNAGHKPTVHTGADVASAIEEILEAARQANPPKEITTMKENGQAERQDAGATNSKGSPKSKPEAYDDPHALARHYRDTLKHSDGWELAFFQEHFWWWNRTCWVQLPDSAMRGRLARFIKQYLTVVFEPTDNQPNMPKVSTGVVSNTMQALNGEVSLPLATKLPSWLGGGPQNRYFLALRNGLLDVEKVLRDDSDVLRPHTPLWFSTVCLPFDFNPDANCARWLAFLDRNLDGRSSGKSKLLQQFMGYLLTPSTSYQRFLMMIGDGANGKSVACAVLHGLLGENNTSTVPLELFGDRFRLAGTLGKLANITAEVGEIDRIAEGQLKAFVTGDPMEFEQKFKAPFTARPTARLVLATNNAPSFSDKSDGLWRRMLLLRFAVRIPEADRIAGMDTPAWWAAGGELPGILNWALVGLHELRQAGQFVVSKDCQAEVDRLRVDANPARRFLEENYQAGPGEIAKADLYGRYAEWCKQRGHHPLAEVGFGKEVGRRFQSVIDGKMTTADGRRNCYKGLQATGN